MRNHRFGSARFLASVALAALLAGATAGCKTTNRDTTGSIAGPTGPRSEADSRRSANAWSERYRADPNDAEAAIAYAQALRETGQRQQASAILERASISSPNNMMLLGAYGRALADVGHYQQAFDVLGRSHTPDRPDWRTLSVQGAVLDQLGKHSEAQRYYASALKIVPGEPKVLSNLGLSYALSKDLPRAETTLRQAVERSGGDVRVRQNLALVVGLQGRFPEAETIAKADLPADEAATNVAYLRQMLAQKTDLKSLSRPGVASPKTSANVKTTFVNTDD
jgi:Flp pilus assembly protein TadD